MKTPQSSLSSGVFFHQDWSFLSLNHKGGVVFALIKKIRQGGVDFSFITCMACMLRGKVAGGFGLGFKAGLRLTHH